MDGGVAIRKSLLRVCVPLDTSPCWVGNFDRFKLDLAMADRPFFFLAVLHQLTVHIPPFPQPWERKERIAARFFKPRTAQFFSEPLVEIPDPDVAQEIAFGIAKPRMRRIGGLLHFRWPDPGILGFDRRCDDQYFLETTVGVSREKHSANPRRDRQSRDFTTDRCQRVILGDGFDFMKRLEAFADGFRPGWVEPWKRLEFIDAQRFNMQNGGCQIASSNLRLSKHRPSHEIRFVVHPNRNPRSQPSAPSRSLIRRGLANRFDRQPLDSAFCGIARDTSSTRIDHITDTRNRQRGFRDVGRQHHTGSTVRLKNSLLLRFGQSRIQRKDIDIFSQPSSCQMTPQLLGGIANVPFRRKECENVTTTLREEFIEAIGESAHRGVVDIRSFRIRSFRRLHFACFAARQAFPRCTAIPNIDRIRPPFHHHDRRWPNRVLKMF